MEDGRRGVFLVEGNVVWLEAGGDRADRLFSVEISDQASFPSAIAPKLKHFSKKILPYVCGDGDQFQHQEVRTCKADLNYGFFRWIHRVMNSILRQIKRYHH
ncbi:uncharacterized protein LOC109706996 isoform X2 [Ananas comosus]|uniref:Uncharacterized protein LOC109706996 isoform X2 n=1 Tax=Ananas comosus TaxID=4615 RepID=A0A6P5EJI2_ANACO|nr:uncharacterized protein LOC109706996 isoform X2 [Ananas comosus]